MEKRYRTKEEMIEYFKELAFRFDVNAKLTGNLKLKGMSEAYEMAASYLERSMEG